MSQRKPKPFTAGEAARAEQAWVMRIYGHVRYTEIAAELGYEGTAGKPLGQVALDAVRQFDDEIRAGLRSRPAEPANPGRGRATVEPWPKHRTAALRNEGA